jgi:hypothetical protein
MKAFIPQLHISPRGNILAERAYTQQDRRPTCRPGRVLGHLACVLTMRGFAMDIKLIAKPLAFALFTASSSRLDGRVAFRSS